MGKTYSCSCFYCKGYTKDSLIHLKEKMVEREIIRGIIEYENRYSDGDIKEELEL